MAEVGREGLVAWQKPSSAAELTELAESTLHEQPERKRQRADAAELESPVVMTLLRCSINTTYC